MENPTHFILIYKHREKVYQTDVILIAHLAYFINNSINWDLPILYIAKLKFKVECSKDIFLSNPNTRNDSALF